MSYFSSFKSAVKFGVSAAWYGSGAGSVVDGARQVYNNSGSGGAWTGMAKGAARMAAGGAALYTLPSAPVRALATGVVSNLLAPDAVEDTWETTGALVKRAGKRTGNQIMIDQGRRLQCGHLSADELFRNHPSEFLRHYAVQSKIQDAGAPGEHSRTRENFQFRAVTAQTSTFPELDRTVAWGRRRSLQVKAWAMMLPGMCWIGVPC